MLWRRLGSDTYRAVMDDISITSMGESAFSALHHYRFFRISRLHGARDAIASRGTGKRL